MYLPFRIKVEDDPRYVHRIPGIIKSERRCASFALSSPGRIRSVLALSIFGGAEPVIVRKAMTQDQGLVMTYHMDNFGAGVRCVV